MKSSVIYSILLAIAIETWSCPAGIVYVGYVE